MLSCIVLCCLVLVLGGGVVTVVLCWCGVAVVSVVSFDGVVLVLV